jgi:hypothetical protein
MRSIRKLVLVVLAALMVCAALASSAFAAATAYDQTTGANLAIGSSVMATSTNSKLSGQFFGIVQTVSCTHASLAGTVSTNGLGTVAAKIVSATWTGCSTATGTCTVTAFASSGVPLSSAAPWDPASTGNMGGLLTLSTTATNIGTGDTGYIEVKTATGSPGPCISNGLGGGPACNFIGGTAGPLTSGTHTLTNYVTGNWTNATPQLAINAAVKQGTGTSCTITTASWAANYEFRTGTVTPGGNPVGTR